MKSEKFAELYEKYGKQTPTKELNSRDEMNQYADYKRARIGGQNHAEALITVQELAIKFAPRPRIEKSESEIDRKYRELRESCEKTRASNPNRAE